MSEQPERFFVSEIIRKHIFLQYRQEVPYGVAGAPQQGRWGVSHRRVEPHRGARATDSPFRHFPAHALLVASQLAAGPCLS